MIRHGYTLGGRLISDHEALLWVPKEHFGCFAVPSFTRNQEGIQYMSLTSETLHSVAASCRMGKLQLVVITVTIGNKTYFTI